MALCLWKRKSQGPWSSNHCGATEAPLSRFRVGNLDVSPIVRRIMDAVPIIATVIPTLQEAPHIERCIRSLMSQSHPAHAHRILVYDGGSDDGSTGGATFVKLAYLLISWSRGFQPFGGLDPTFPLLINALNSS